MAHKTTPEEKPKQTGARMMIANTDADDQNEKKGKAPAFGC